MANTFKVGDLTIHRIVEMECGFTPALEFLPDLKPEVLAENRSWLAPSALDAQDNLVLCFQSYIVQTPRHTILVDSCIGNDKERTARPLWHQKKDDAWMRGLAAPGPDGERHRHRHVHPSARRSYRLEHAAGERPLGADLPQGALSVLQDRAGFLAGGECEDRTAADRRQRDPDRRGEALRPGHQSDHALDDLVSLIPTPGHTIDHYAVQLGRGGKDAVITGDLIHTPLQARYPELAMRVDYDPKQGAATRRKFLETYCDTNTLCCFAHFPSPSRGHIKRWGDGFKCDYVAS